MGVDHASADAAVARSDEPEGTHRKRLHVQTTQFHLMFRPTRRPTLGQLLLVVLAIAIVGGGIVAQSSWQTLAAAFSASTSPTATTTTLAFQRAFAATQTVQAGQLTHDYTPTTGIGLCDTVDPPYGSTTEHAYWESQGTVRCPGAGVTALDHGGSVAFYGFPTGFPLAYQVSATFTLPSSSAARSCVLFDVGSVGGRTVDISLCNDGTWSGNGGAASGAVSAAGSYVVTISVMQTTGAVSVNGATVIPSAPLLGETYRIQIDAAGLSAGAVVDVSNFVLHPTPA